LRILKRDGTQPTACSCSFIDFGILGSGATTSLCLWIIPSCATLIANRRTLLVAPKTHFALRMALTLALQHLLRDIFLPFQLIQSAADLDYQRNTLQGPLRVSVYYNTLHAYPAKALHNSGDVVAALSAYKLPSSPKDVQKHVGRSFAKPNCSTTNSASMKLDKPAENVMFIVYKKLNTIMPGHYIQSKVILPQLNVLCPDFETTASRYDLLSSRYLEYLSRDESFEILRQFERLPLKPGRQVMWSGVPREWVQIWADEHDMQTLTTAMGPLMDKNNPLCKRNNKSPRAWSRYIMGASGLFAEHLPKGQVVTVLLRPPPYRLDPRGLSTYQMLEQPVLKGELGGMAVIRIDVVHITVRGAEDSAYQFWPVDEGYQWTQKHDASHLSTSSGRRYLCEIHLLSEYADICPGKKRTLQLHSALQLYQYSKSKSSLQSPVLAVQKRRRRRQNCNQKWITSRQRVRKCWQGIRRRRQRVRKFWQGTRRRRRWLRRK
jgi:hypothetical protein